MAQSSVLLIYGVLLAMASSSMAASRATSPASLVPSPAPAPAPEPPIVNLTDLLTVAGPFHTFLDALIQTKVMDTFQNQANNTQLGITIFAPTDSAFASLKKPSLANLTADQLKSVLLYHALPRYYSLAQFKNLSLNNPIGTFAGSQYTLNFSDSSGLIRVDSGWSNPKISSSVLATFPVAVYEIQRVLLPVAIFGVAPPPAPAPAPAPDTGTPSDLAPVGSGGAGARSPSSTPASSAQALNVGARAVGEVILAILGGLMLVL